MTPFTFGTRLDGSVGDLRPRVEAALKAEGFGIITEINLQATYREKLGIETSPYVILGACNPRLSYEAIGVEPAIGALLPCNVVLRAEGGQTVVEAMDPVAVLALVHAPGIEEMAREVRARLERAIDSLG